MDNNEEMQKQLEAAQKEAKRRADELSRVLNKNEELLSETKQAKAERNELKESVSTLQQQLEDMKNNSLLGEENMQKVNDLVAQKLELRQAEFETKLEEAQNRYVQTETQFNELRQKYDNERISGALRQAAEKAGVIPSAIDDVIHRANGVFRVSEEGTIEARDRDGNLVKEGKKVMSPDVFVDSLKESAGHLWPQSQGVGAQGSNGSGTTGPNPFAKDTINYTEQARLVKSDPQKAARLKAQAEG